ncbi:MAG: helix-turn-helix transcriptional regulator, partial [Bryobacteraceae bacterium]
ENRLLAVNDSLDRLPWGVLLVKADARILWRNAAAERIMSKKDGLTESSDGLRAATMSESQGLRSAIAAAARTSNGDRLPGAAMPLSRPSGLRPLNVLVSPVPRWSGSLQEADAMVFVGDPEDRPAAAPQILQRLFGLTAAESRLAEALVEGDTVEAYAVRTAVSLNTARTHLKQIFAKTGTMRQSGLVRHLLRSVAGMREPTKNRL